MIKQLITEFPLSDVPRERSISREKITKYAYTKEEVDLPLDAAVEKAVAEAFDELYYFERACETYLTALSTNKKLKIVSDEVAEKTAQEWSDYPSDNGRAHLDQIRLILDKEEPDYKN